MSPSPTENPFVTLLNKYLEDARSFFLDAAIALTVNGISGDYVEFGSWGAKSLKLAHEALVVSTSVPRHLWAFDSFAGLPPAADRPATCTRSGALGGPAYGWGSRPDQEDDDGLEAFRRQCDEMGIPREAYTAVEGYFEDSLPPLGADGPPADMALAYVDCNMYSSTVTVLRVPRPRGSSTG